MSRLFRSPGRKSDDLAPENDVESEQVLKEIRTDFAQDGVKWSVSPDRKLAHVWRKYQRTNNEYKKTVEEVQNLKKQRKREYDDMEKSILTIRNLSQSKENLIGKLKSDNEKNTKQIQQLKMEREAYLKGNQAIADLLVTEGMTEFDRANPQKYIEQLVKDKKKCTEEKREMEDRYGEFQILKAQELNELKEQLQSKNTKLQDADKELEKLKQEVRMTSDSLATAEKKHADAQKSIVDQSNDVRLKESAIADSMKELKDKLEAETRKYEETLKHLQEELAEEKMKTEESELARTAAQKALRISEESYTKAMGYKEEAETKMLELQASQQVTETLKQEVKGLELLKSLSQKLEEREKELFSLEQQNKEMKAEVEKVKTALKEALAMNDVHKTRIANLERENRTVKEEFKDVEVEKVQLRATSEEISLKKEETLQQLKVQISELTSELESASNESQIHVEKINRLQEEIKTLKQDLKNVSSAAEQQVMSLEKTIEDEKITKSALKKETEEKEEEEKDYKQATEQRIQHLMDELKKSETEKDKIKQSCTKTIKDELVKKEEEMSLQQKTVVEKRVDEVVQEREMIKKELQKSRDSLSQFASHVKEMVILKTDTMDTMIAQMKIRLDGLEESFQKQISRLTDWRVSWRRKENDLEEKVKNGFVAQSHAEKECNLLKLSMEKIEKRNFELQEEIILLEEQKVNMEKEIRDLREISESVKSSSHTNIQQVKEAKKNVEQELKRAKEQIKKQKSSEEKLQDQMQKLTEQTNAQFEALQQEKEVLNKKFTKLKSSNQTVSKRNSSLEVELSTHQQAITELQKSIEEEKSTLQSELQSQTHQKELTEAKLKDEEKKTRDLLDKLQSMTTRLSSLQADSDTTKSQKETELQTIRSSLIEEQQKQYQIQEEIKTWQGACAMKDQEISKLKSQLKVQEDLSLANQQLVQQTKHDKEKLDSLTRQLSRKEKEFKSVQEKMEGTENRLKFVMLESAENQSKADYNEKEIEKLQDQLDNTRTIMHSVEEDKGKVTATLTKTQDNLERANASMESNRREIAELQSLILQKDANTTELQATLTTCRKQLTSLQNEKVIGQSQLTDIDGEMNTMREELGILESQNRIKEATLRSLEDEVAILRTKQVQLGKDLEDKDECMDLMISKIEKLRAKYSKKKEQLTISKREEKSSKEMMASLMNEVAVLKLKCQAANHRLEDYQSTYTEKHSEAKEMLQMTKERYEKKKWNMTSRIDKMDNELFLTKSELDQEIQWRNHTSDVYQQLLKEKGQLFLQITELEKRLRDKSIKVIEQETIIQRLEQENQMIERKFDESLNSSLTNSYNAGIPVSTMSASFQPSSGHRSSLLNVSDHGQHSTIRLNRTH